MRSKKAEMGAGTLIIFIALLLVAAVAAGVLLQTAGSLQQKALSTGAQAQQEIATNARVMTVSAVDGLDQALDNFSMQIKLSPGSAPIKLDEVIITFDTDNQSVSLVYSGDTSFATSGDSGTFGVTYLINGSNHVDGNLQKGDVIEVDLQSPYAVGEDERVRMNFVPKGGAATLVEFNTPDVISTLQTFVYP